MGVWILFSQETHISGTPIRQGVALYNSFLEGGMLLLDTLQTLSISTISPVIVLMTTICIERTTHIEGTPNNSLINSTFRDLTSLEFSWAWRWWPSQSCPTWPKRYVFEGTCPNPPTKHGPKSMELKEGKPSNRKSSSNPTINFQVCHICDFQEG